MATEFVAGQYFRESFIANKLSRFGRINESNFLEIDALILVQDSSRNRSDGSALAAGSGLHEAVEQNNQKR